MRLLWNIILLPQKIINLLYRLGSLLLFRHKKFIQSKFHLCLLQVTY